MTRRYLKNSELIRINRTVKGTYSYQIFTETMADAGADFFFKYGFKLLYKGKRSYFKHILHKDVPLYVFGKKIGKD